MQDRAIAAKCPHSLLAMSVPSVPQAPEIAKYEWKLRLPAQLFARFKALAKVRGMTAPRFLERVMVAVLDGEDAEVGLPDVSDGSRRGRLHVRLTSVEVEAVRAAAKVEGHTLAGWVAGVIRARLKAEPIYTKDEVEALSLATLQMQAIGRNLNSAIHRLHIEGRWYEQAAQMKDVSAMISAIADRMNAVVDKATDRSRF